MSNKELGKIEIIVSPIKKIVVFESTELSIEEFFERIRLMAMTGQPIALNWSEGMVFIASPYQPDSDVIIEQTLKGTIFWGGLIFASMPKYEPIKKLGGREVPIIDQTSMRHLRQVAQWLKKGVKSPQQ